MSQNHYTTQSIILHTVWSFFALQHWLLLGKIEKFAHCTEGQSVTCRWWLRRWRLRCIKFGAQSVQRSKVLQISSWSANPILSTGPTQSVLWTWYVFYKKHCPTSDGQCPYKPSAQKKLPYFRILRKFTFDGSGKCRYWAGVAAHETQMGPNSCHFPRSASACCLTFHFPNLQNLQIHLDI